MFDHCYRILKLLLTFIFLRGLACNWSSMRHISESKAKLDLSNRSSMSVEKVSKKRVRNLSNPLRFYQTHPEGIVFRNLKCLTLRELTEFWQSLFEFYRRQFHTL